MEMSWLLACMLFDFDVFDFDALNDTVWAVQERMRIQIVRTDLYKQQPMHQPNQDN
jgi:hypothetical protein